jgi:acyl-CoA thioester hydrolase
VSEAFELPVSVEPADIDEMGHVNNVTYLRWVQQAAAAHWNALAAPDDRARVLWIVLRHEIDYKQPAYEGDRVIARTWVGTASRVRFERFTEIARTSDGANLAHARTIWCPIDAETRRPVAVSAEVRAVFSNEKSAGKQVPPGVESNANVRSRDARLGSSVAQSRVDAARALHASFRRGVRPQQPDILHGRDYFI